MNIIPGPVSPPEDVPVADGTTILDVTLLTPIVPEGSNSNHTVIRPSVSDARQRMPFSTVTADSDAQFGLLPESSGESDDNSSTYKNPGKNTLYMYCNPISTLLYLL